MAELEKSGIMQNVYSKEKHIGDLAMAEQWIAKVIQALWRMGKTILAQNCLHMHIGLVRGTRDYFFKLKNLSDE